VKFFSAVSVFRENVLQETVALITGAGSGICLGIARAYVAHGARVCLVGRDLAKLERAAADLGDAAICAAADVRQPDQIERAVAAAVTAFGRLDTVVCGAAGNFLAPLAGLSPNGFRTVIDIDLCGSFNTARASFDALKASGDGLVLNISATLQMHGTPMQAHAAAAKAGVDALTRTQAVEWGPLGIRSVAIAPGPIGDTEGMRRLAPGPIGERLSGSIPLRRFGTVAEIAQLAVYVRSPAGAYISGTVLVVDGAHSVAQPVPGS
jgi:peroxisomal 2,4-dienoyl-CoA reductase